MQLEILYTKWCRLNENVGKSQSSMDCKGQSEFDYIKLGII